MHTHIQDMSYNSPAYIRVHYNNAVYHHMQMVHALRRRKKVTLCDPFTFVIVIYI